MNILCRIFHIHKWKYTENRAERAFTCRLHVDKEAPLRKCSRCNLEQTGSYDMMYGSTRWQ